MLVGEQPGDQEDLAGRPFVGTAGRMLDRALDEAGIERSKVQVTTAAKHFKFAQPGKRHLHAKPSAGEIEPCRWWDARENSLVKPHLKDAFAAPTPRPRSAPH